jgi:iron complex transport system ATP-binding protein
MVGILGPNGAGKTTLLRAISKVLKPQVGVVLLDGRDIYRMSEKEVAREMAVVPQTSPSIPNFTALEIVLMGRNPFLKRLESESEIDLAIAKEAMELTDTWHLANRPVSEVSGGERQKITIARAITQQPKVLLLDEPTLHLDVASQIEIMELVKKLCVEKKLAVLSVFHDFNLAAKYCDKLLLIAGGKVVAAGSPEDVLTTESILKTYGVQAVVKRHPITGSLYVMALSPTERMSDNQVKGNVHVICGGGTGAELMHRLVESGWLVSAGVLNLLDTDYECAEALRIPVVSEAPFSTISDDAFKENIQRIHSAEVVIVSDFPVGSGNLRNLEAAVSAVDMGIPTIVIKGSDTSQRDFTCGEAGKHYKMLFEKGALVAGDVEEALRIVAKYGSQRIKLGQSQHVVSGEPIDHS